MLGETLERVYNGSASLLVAHLLDQSHPSGAELKQIRSLLDEYQHRGSDPSQKGGIRMQAHAIEAFKSLIEWLIWPALLHSIWFGLLAASVVALVLQTFKHLSHRARHGVLLTAHFPDDRGACCRHVARAPDYQPIEERPGERRRDYCHCRIRQPESGTAHDDARPGVSYQARSPFRDLSARFLVLCLAYLADALQQVRVFVATAWLLGVVMSGGFLVVGIESRASPASGSRSGIGSDRARVRKLARRLKLKKPPTVLVHPRIDEPCLTGLFEPAILLPGRLLASTGADLLDAILSHELAHARRQDHVVNLAQRLVEALLFFHPAVHWLSRSLRRQREFCTDRLAVRATRNPLAMASALESVALLRFSSPPPRLPARR